MIPSFQIAVIGGGPGGYVAAIRAAQRGASVILVEKDAVGGTCLNRGCIPSKALIAAAKHYEFLKSADRWGFNIIGLSFDWAKISARKDRIVAQLVRGIEHLLKKNKISLVQGKARLLSPREILIETDKESLRLKAEKIILATGSENADLPLFPINSPNIVTSEEALSWNHLPASLLIVGGGIIGSEFAMLFSCFGVTVTLVEVLPSILAMSSLDSAIIQRLEEIMKRNGIQLKLDTRIAGMEVDVKTGSVNALLENGEILKSQKAMICIGRRPNTHNLGIEDLGIAVTRQGGVTVDEKMETNIPGIYAIGDMNGQWQLAHVASFQGIVAAEAATGHKPFLMQEGVIPSCIFTSPPAATVGLSEKEALEKGYLVQTGLFPYGALGKAIAMGESEGLIKVISEKGTDCILGAHLLGEGSTDLVHEFAVAIQHRLSTRDLMGVIHSHPTYSESIPEVCESIFGIGIHT